MTSDLITLGLALIALVGPAVGMLVALVKKGYDRADRSQDKIVEVLSEDMVASSTQRQTLTTEVHAQTAQIGALADAVSELAKTTLTPQDVRDMRTVVDDAGRWVRRLERAQQDRDQR